MGLTGQGGYLGDRLEKRPLRMPYIERSRSAEGYGLGSHCPNFGIAVLASCWPFDNGVAGNKVGEAIKDSETMFIGDSRH